MVESTLESSQRVTNRYYSLLLKRKNYYGKVQCNPQKESY